MENTYRQLGTQKESRQTERHTLKEIDAKGREKERQTGKEEEIWIYGQTKRCVDIQIVIHTFVHTYRQTINKRSTD